RAEFECLPLAFSLTSVDVFVEPLDRKFGVGTEEFVAVEAVVVLHPVKALLCDWDGVVDVLNVLGSRHRGRAPGPPASGRSPISHVSAATARRGGTRCARAPPYRTCRIPPRCRRT